MDETYAPKEVPLGGIKVAGQWKYLDRAVDRAGATVDFLLTAERDLAAARRSLDRTLSLHGVPGKITINKTGANTAAIHSVNADASLDIEPRQCKYLNNIVEQDHRAIKRRTRPMLGFKTFRCARAIIGGIETMHMIKKGQVCCPGGTAMSAAASFYSLAF
jgi:transposase-like protein